MSNSTRDFLQGAVIISAMFVAVLLAAPWFAKFLDWYYVFVKGV